MEPRKTYGEDLKKASKLRKITVTCRYNSLILLYQIKNAFSHLIKKLIGVHFRLERYMKLPDIDGRIFSNEI